MARGSAEAELGALLTVAGALRETGKCALAAADHTPLE